MRSSSPRSTVAASKLADVAALMAPDLVIQELLPIVKIMVKDASNLLIEVQGGASLVTARGPSDWPTDDDVKTRSA